MITVVSVRQGRVLSSNTGLANYRGVTPGAHPAICRYFIRKIRISATNLLVDLCRKHEEISQEKYHELILKCIPITSGNIVVEDDYSNECASGA